MKRGKQSGQALAFTAVALVVLCGFTGLAMDMGVLRYQRRAQQTAADAAAIAGAQNLNFGSGVTAGAQLASSQNGFTDNGGGAVSACDDTAAVGTICVQVVNPPTNVTFNGQTISGGPHAGTATANKYVEVLVAEVHPTYFMTLLGVTKKTVLTRAVATNITGGTNSSCLYTLGKPITAIVGVAVQGKAHLSAPNCGISDNGNLDTTGNAYTVVSKTLSVAGSCQGTDCSSPNVTCTAYPNGVCPPIGGAAPVADPLTGIVPPTKPANSTSCPDPACNFVSTTDTTIFPGHYSSILIGKNNNVVMTPGIYYIDGAGGLGFNGGGQLSTPNFSTIGADGVMIYFTGSASLNKVNGGANLPDINLNPLNASQSSTYQGMLFYQDPSDTTVPWFGGDNQSTFNGTVYFPTTTLTFYGNTNINFNGTVITYAVSINGNPTVNFGKSPAGAPVPAFLTQPVLVE